MELWLSEIEGQLQSEDFGKDLTSVQNLLKKHALVEADVNSHQDRIDGVKIAADQFCSAGHFDAENIKAKHAALSDRYTALMKPMSARKQVPTSYGVWSTINYFVVGRYQNINLVFSFSRCLNGTIP